MGLLNPENVEHPDRALARLAAKQHGVVARRQLSTVGLSDTMVRDRVARAQLLRLHRGVYAVGHDRLRREGRWLAAVLAVGDGAALSHRDAAALHGLSPLGDHARWEVTTTGRASSTRAIRVFRTTALDVDDVTSIDGIAVTSVARTLADLAGTVPRARLRKALNEAERQRSFDLRAIEGALERTRTRNGGGHAALRRALEELRAIGADVTRLELEDRFLALLDAERLPRPQTNYGIEGMEVDACWPRQRLVVELDGWGAHATRRAFQEDRERGNALELAGWRVLRFTWADVTRWPMDTVATVRGALACGRRYPPDP
ncbi:MAG: type IV toxin-antitoxin system AbiEi family antitoxin domain-containing protein [Conexibacter sp.]